jgi:regulator of sigma E protease
MYIAAAILAFGLLIAVHELGHFGTARAFNVKVNEFALGMGPKILKKQRGETLYSLRLLPLGGFCAMEGEDDDSEDPRSFTNKTWWKQCIILVAGASANFLIGYLAVFVLRLTDGEGIGYAFRASWYDVVYFVKLIIESLGMLFNGTAGIKDLSGPVGIVAAVGEVVQKSGSTSEAVQNAVFFFSFIAVNLGLMNLLPIPALDGGRVFFTIITAAIEKLLKRKVSRKVEGFIHAGTFILLIGLMVFTLFNDIVRVATS